MNPEFLLGLEDDVALRKKIAQVEDELGVYLVDEYGDSASLSDYSRLVDRIYKIYTGIKFTECMKAFDKKGK